MKRFIETHFDNKTVSSFLVKGRIAQNGLFGLSPDPKLAIKNYQAASKIPSSNDKELIMRMQALYQEAHIWMSEHKLEKCNQILEKLLQTIAAYQEKKPNKTNMISIKEEVLRLKTLLPLKISSEGVLNTVVNSEKISRPVGIQSHSGFNFWKSEKPETNTGSDNAETVTPKVIQNKK